MSRTISEYLFSLSNFFNYPNPFSAVSAQKTSFRYSLANQLQSGTLKVYDIAGRLLYNYKLNDSQLDSGTHTILWDGKTNNGNILGTGVYYAIIDFNSSKKTNLVKVVIINE